MKAFFLTQRSRRTQSSQRNKKSSAVFANSFLALSALMFFSECAQVVMPNGGPKDVTPPRAIKYLPDSAATNFRSKEINIVFNEYIQLKDVSNQLIVSPLLDEQPEIKLIKNHILNIEFKKPLKENTTYTMNFGNSIADYNEGNAIDNFQYVFSTGAFIDSLSLSGKVQYAFDHKTEKSILIMLYDASTYSDSTPYKTQPSYFGKTNADGTYKINNIRTGKYKMFALKDANSNYKYNESEVIGFVDQAIEINKNTSVDVELFKEAPKKLKLLSARAVDYGHVVFAFNKSAWHTGIQVWGNKKLRSELREPSLNHDTIDFWFDEPALDSIRFQLYYDNSNNFDTVDVKLISKEKAVRLNKNKLKFLLSSNALAGQDFDLNKDIELRSNHPIGGFNSYGKILISDHKKAGISKDTVYYPEIIFQKKDENSSDQVLIYTVSPDTTFEKNDTIITPKKIEFKESTKYSLIIFPGTIKDIFGTPNDTFKVNFKTREERFYGNIKLKLLLPSGGNYILQFLDARETIVKEEMVNESKTFKYDYLQPGAYKLKLILDSNKDGKWSAGNYLEKTQAEKVIYYDKPITIRSNWDLELEWKINE